MNKKEEIYDEKIFPVMEQIIKIWEEGFYHNKIARNYFCCGIKIIFRGSIHFIGILAQG